MYSKLLYKYDSITKEIESEKRRNSDKGMLLHTPHILSKGKNNENEYLLRKEKYKIAIFSLLCMRIALNCQLILNGYDKNQKQLSWDIFDAVEYAKAIENKTDDIVIFDTLDIITAVCPLCEKFIMSNTLKNFPFIAYRNNIFIFTSELYFLFNFVADYWEEKKEYKLCCGILEYLYTISRKRNNIDIHREVTVGILRRIVEKAPEIACKIGNADAFKFENIIDKYSGDFFWFYAYSLSKTGNTADAGKFFKKCYNIRKAIYGENNWFTAIAKREYGVALISSSEYKRGCEILFNFADNIESGLYEETDKNILSIIEGKTLYLPLTILMEKNDIDDLKKYNFYLKIYEKICAEYNNNMAEPLLKLRLAGNLRASYYFITGNYIQAEMAFIEALNAKAPKETLTVISVSQIKINLLMAYFAQNDLGKALPLMI